LFKTCNKLPQVLARAQAELQAADEALLANTEGFLVEGAAGNLFWIQQGTVCTPPLDCGILAGVTRQVVLDLCRELRVPVQQRNITGPELAQTEGVFLSLSSSGIVQAVSLDRQPLTRSPLTERLHRRYWELVRRETGS
jgi:branched-subunit amino acid aminotransferase/4-amino-4-deoxychorismate lyase